MSEDQKNYTVKPFPKGGIALPFHTLVVTLGGIAEKPAILDGQIEIREYLNVTLSFDHDIIDGGPATRYLSQ